ncbi:acyl-CoA dehydrogenase family protein [Plantibacter flavus]|uniref:acyl-CoA dehydrogenase family protein n=1 Tax=Plantibacter flavus TaxID=150123 RepID=UPI003F1792E4
MTTASSTTARPVGLQAAREHLLPLFTEIQAGAVERELEHRLPREEVRKLAEAGFGALRVPTEFGGSGLTFPEFTELLIELAAADSNLPQIFRGHIALVEDQLVAAPSAQRTAWLERFVAGELVGNAWSEVGSGALGVSGTVVSVRDGAYVVNGRKFYTTGSIYADWTDATARLVVDGEPDTEVTVLVRTNQLGVTIADDWDGFGQQLTGTGTIVFEDAVVDADQVHAFTDRFRYQTALYQHVLIAVHAGIAAAVERDAGEQIRARTRVYSHGLAPLVKDDGQIQAVVGEISSIAFVARQTVLGVAAAIERASATAADRDSADDLHANIEAEIRSAQAQVVLSELVPKAATLLFNTLGASAVSRKNALDRHWRNARTVASHNPVIYKTRIVGDWSINGTPPPFVWAVGTAKPDAS